MSSRIYPTQAGAHFFIAKLAVSFREGNRFVHIHQATIISPFFTKVLSLQKTPSVDDIYCREYLGENKKTC